MIVFTRLKYNFDEDYCRKRKNIDEAPLTKQQRNRIEKNQLDASTETNVQQAHIKENSENIGLEKHGTVIASYGAQIDVEEINFSKRVSRRCH